MATYLSTDPTAGTAVPRPGLVTATNPAAPPQQPGMVFPGGTNTLTTPQLTGTFGGPLTLTQPTPANNAALATSTPINEPGLNPDGSLQPGYEWQTNSLGIRFPVPVGTPNISNPQAPGFQISGGAYSGSPSDVNAWLQWMAQQPGHDPILDTPGGIQYYTQAIQNSGGLNANNLQYWQQKATLAQYGGGVGAGGGSGWGGSFGSLYNTVPTADQAANMPGIQFAEQQVLNNLQNSAAARGDVLSGGALKDIADYSAGTALSQGYIPLSQLQLGYSNANFNNLYNLGQLGYNASSFGPSSPV